MMIDTIIEIVINLFQSFMYFIFLFLFFNNQKKTKKDYIGLFLFIAIFFAALTFFSFSVQYLNFIDTVIYLIIMEAYTLIMLKGNVFARMIMPLVAFMINTIVSFVFAYAISYFTHQTLNELIMESTIYRYLCMIVVNLTNALIYFIIIKFNHTKLKLTKWTDIMAFIIIPIISILIIYSTLYISALTKYQSDILGFLITICLCIIAVAVTTWLMMIKISKNNEIQTKLLLMQQREQLYEKDILHTNEQIENISKVKHDMKNNILCISKLISSGKYNEAKDFCDSLSENLETIYTPINTNNPLLNAVINVELEKAFSNNINFKTQINEEAVSNLKNTDIVSIIGNMCDNAIEYLVHQTNSKREMSLEILYKKSYIIITCKNKIYKSILKKNPDLLTTKSNKLLHGKGMSIISDCVKKYGGELKCYEKDNYLYVSAIIHN